MSTLHIRRRGGASKYEIWARYRDPLRWREWAPQIREVRADGPLRTGLEGEIVGVFGVRARFDVLDVDEPGGRWTWIVRSGPLTLRIEHEIAEGLVGVALTGPAPVVAAYAPIARVALGRLVARSMPLR
jgi:hypothetical protein